MRKLIFSHITDEDAKICITHEGKSGHIHENCICIYPLTASHPILLLGISLKIQDKFSKTDCCDLYLGVLQPQESYQGGFSEVWWWEQGAKLGLLHGAMLGPLRVPPNLVRVLPDQR